MHPCEPLHICEDCDVRHYDNCPDCFGFGWHGVPGRRSPVSANAAMRTDGPPKDATHCPTCRSTWEGAPTEAAE